MPSRRLACAPPIPHPANIRRSATGNRVGTTARHCNREPAAEHCHRKITTAPAVNTSTENRRRKLAASISVGKPLLKNRCRKRSAAPRRKYVSRRLAKRRFAAERRAA